MDVIIRKAGTGDLKPALEIIDACKRDMEAKGIEQWPSHYPGSDVLAGDIAAESMFIALIDGLPAGIIVLHPEMPEVYRDVAWRYSGGRVNSVHRLAVLPAYREYGLAAKLLAYAERLALDRGYKIIRLDTYSKNLVAFRFYQKSAYRYAGDIRLKYMPGVYHCFEKSL